MRSWKSVAKMNIVIKFDLIGFLLVMSAVTVPKGAASTAERVQLSAFLVNVVESGIKKTGQLPHTVYLGLRDLDEARYVCGIAPRIRDTLIKYLFKQTYYLDTKGKLGVAKIRLDLWPITYKAIPNVKLRNMLVVKGTGKVGSSEVRLFARRGCRHVSD